MILGFLVALATFPGVIIHELAHQLMCWMLKIPVLEVCYFRIGFKAGYVRHEMPNEPWKTLVIGIGPILINTVIGFVIAFPAGIGAFVFDSPAVTMFDLFQLWLGLSIAMHAFPSLGDAQAIWTALMKKENSLCVKIVALPVVGLILVGAIGSIFWLDAIYGLLVTVGLPYYIVHALAGAWA